MSDELDPSTPPMPEARPAEPAPLPPPPAVPLGDPLLAAEARPVTAGRGGTNRTRTIAGVAALAAGVAITAGIAVAARDDSATASATIDASTGASTGAASTLSATSDQPATQSSAQDGTVDELPSLDAGSATGDAGAALDGDGRVRPGDGGAQIFGGAPPEGGRGHHGEMAELGVVPDQGGGAGSAVPAPGSETGTPDASSQGS